VQFQSSSTSNSRLSHLLLLPDLGTAPLASYRSNLQALVEWVQFHDVVRKGEPELVVGIFRHHGNARAEAWLALLNELRCRSGTPPLRARVLNFGAASGSRHRKHPVVSQVDALFRLAARHPFLTRQQFASLLRTSTRRVAPLLKELFACGWLRPVSLDHLVAGARALDRREARRLGLVELTEAGRREAARRLLVPAGLARRRHGLVRGEAAGRRFIRHLHHTLGANAFFVALAATNRHGDNDCPEPEGLVEWRSAAASARGRFRPDGYGCFCQGGWRTGFFLEYDRGTEKPGQHAAKLAAYYRFRASGAYRRDYSSFPAVLVVATSDEAESRFAYQAFLAQERHGGEPMRIFLTTTGRIAASPNGALGQIWRSGSRAWSSSAGRACWLPSVSYAPAVRPRQLPSTMVSGLDASATDVCQHFPESNRSHPLIRFERAGRSVKPLQTGLFTTSLVSESFSSTPGGVGEFPA
jgi:hypothetical protein